MSRKESLWYIGLLLLAAVLYVWNLSINGWANAYYAAAAQAGASDWKAFFFGSSDLGNGITVDKLPASIWVSSMSVRLFGLSSWSLLVPQALMGVGTIALTYVIVRRHFHMTAALLAGGIALLTPAAAVMFRYNSPDALLTLLLVTSLYLVVRAVEDGRWRWLLGAGIAVGLGFLTKSAQALIILPVLGLVYLFAGPAKMGRRVLQLLASTGAAAVAAGWWVVIAENSEAMERPYAGGSFTNSFVEVLLRQNGLGRLVGTAAGGSSQTEDIKSGPLKLLMYPTFGTQGAWLLIIAMMLLISSLVLLRRRPINDPKRAVLLLAGGWLFAYSGVFSFMSGVINPYYLVALAPPLGIVVGAGAQLSWAARRWLPFRLAHAVTFLVSAMLAAGYLAISGGLGSPLALVVLIAAVILAELLIFRIRKRIVVRATAIATTVVCLIGPSLFTISAVLNPHVGIWPAATLPAATVVFDSPAPDDWPADSTVAARGTAIGHSPDKAVLDLLAADASGSRWTAATPGASNAARYQLESGASVLPIGGFNGSTPFPTLNQFRDYAQTGEIRYYISRSDSENISAEAGFADEITAWVRANFTPRVIGEIEVYDLQRP
ncbi:glycosyltransferase family 39 protein [Arthrobacter sp. BE255]|uniref:glycosyltransferase family 39 protein n=1 Tax=Arthrobacter sp. BE255 TaxID=2817721 RepID=UPI00285FD94A|nr:glycosyltransferase family 39 protein [Arthrobacter sp. BE255]MDR7157536.1 4-amino-4-deoxy-L-arabinose transferase-like glycosyltransferase [Arthrobacter sp. BE255]